jgi:dTDP-4-dehydrorhamnose reductase
MIGAVLVTRFAAQGWSVYATTRRRDRVDETHPYLDLSALGASFGAAPGDDLPKVDVVVLAAAVAGIGDCEENADASRQINVDGTLGVAKAMAARGAFVLLLSSDKVFDGAVPLRSRHDAPCPACAYGRQKADAEAGVLALGQRAAVLRLSKVLEPNLPLLNGWATTLANEEPITPFHDLYLAPVSVDLVARMVLQIATDRAQGIFHCTGAKDHSYEDLAHILAEQMHRNPGLIQPGSCHSINMPAAARPRYTSLEMTEEQSRWGITAPAFEATARAIMAGL